MKKVIKPIFNIIEQIHKWLFYEHTRIMECFNAFALMGFATVMFLNYTIINTLPSYTKFAYVSPKWWWLVMTGLGVMQGIAILCESNRSNQISGYVLMLSGAVWALIALTFNMDTATTTSTVIYSMFALFCSLTGLELFTNSDSTKGNKNVNANYYVK